MWTPSCTGTRRNGNGAGNRNRRKNKNREAPVIDIYINPALGSCLTIALIFLDYINKYDTDPFQRKIFLFILGAAFMAVTTDFAGNLLSGIGGTTVTVALYAVLTSFFLFQNLTYYLAFMFIDYFAHKNILRSRKILKFILLFLGLYTVSTLINLPLHYYFHISMDNRYTPGRLYVLRLAVSYLPILLAVSDMIFSIKIFRKAEVYSLVFFALLTGSGAALDIVIRIGSLTWPCFAAGLLYIYFFIVQSDSKIDSLTGTGNRYSFNEFTDKLSRLSVKQSWVIMMIDMDHFKEINDKYGHLEGDKALRDMADIIKSTIRHSDFTARYGGDEFVLAVREDNDIEKLLARLREAIARRNRKQTKPYRIEMSYGYDIYTTGIGQSMDEFLKHIDTLMYRDKAEHRRKEDGADRLGLFMSVKNGL
jgi:diguanylate cyclase (GGDEF)-like protein